MSEKFGAQNPKLRGNGDLHTWNNYWPPNLVKIPAQLNSLEYIPPSSGVKYSTNRIIWWNANAFLEYFELKLKFYGFFPGSSRLTRQRLHRGEKSVLLENDVRDQHVLTFRLDEFLPDAVEAHMAVVHLVDVSSVYQPASLPSHCGKLDPENLRKYVRIGFFNMPRK